MKYFFILAPILSPWLALWLHTIATRRVGTSHPGLMGASRMARYAWADAMSQRTVRVMDAALMGTLTNMGSFFASTTLLIIGGCLALLCSPDRLADLRSIAASLPFSVNLSQSELEARLASVALFFALAFFKFSWSIRQLNFAAIALGATPDPTPNGPSKETLEWAARFASLSTLAGDNFNQGLRCYYFSLAAITGIWHWGAPIFLSIFIAFILWRREFDGATLAALGAPVSSEN